MYLYKCILILSALINRINVKSSQLIGGGKPANITNFPWQALLIETKDRYTLCGGFIISSQFLMTAAHCLDKYCPTVYLGYERLDGNETKDHCGLTVETEASRLFPHPEFKNLGSHVINDIALVMLDIPVKFGVKIQPIKIPFKKIRNLHKYPAVVAGYGVDESEYWTDF